MKRYKKGTALSYILVGISGVSIVLLFLSGGNVLFGILAIMLFIFSRFAMKKESYLDYRDRYEEKYGLKDETEDTDEESK